MSEQLRALMRLLTHSVVVCTSTATAGPSQRPTPRAMTMSSFTSLALSPTPVVSFNVATPSRTLDAIRASGCFNVHVLKGGVAGARVADWFTQGNDQGHKVFEELSSCGVELVGADSGEAANQKSGLEPPVLKGVGVLYVIRCKLLDEPSGGLIPVRDHVIVLGEVVEIIEASATKGIRGANDCFGLIYADRRYRQPGNTLIRSDSPQPGRPGSEVKD